MTLDVFRTPPAPLSPLERRVVLLATIVVAVSRLLASAKTLWDWDEALFVSAVQDYDVTRHHPHPPGFPIYIALAKFASLFTSSDFRALQVVVVFSAIALFPLAFLFCRELRLGFRTSFLGALLFVFFPTIWYYGGTAFSDVASVAVILAACALLLRGCRDARAYYAGAIVLGIAAGIRPQSLVMGLPIALVASWIQLRLAWRRVLLAALLGAIVLAASYGGAMRASASVGGYLFSVKAHAKYIHEIDGFTNPERFPLSTLVDPIFLRPMRGGRLAFVVLAFAIIGIVASLVRRHIGVWLLIATYAPFAIIAWLTLDPYSSSRFAVAWVFLHAGLAAFGAASLASLIPRLAAFIEVVLLIAITARFAYWTWPAVHDAHSSPSPTAAALAWAGNQRGTIYLQAGLWPHADVLLPGRTRVVLERAEELPDAPDRTGVWVTEGITDSLDTKFFRYEHPRILQIVRQRYLVVSATPVSGVPLFGGGWYDSESYEASRWRWMGRRSVTTFPATSPRAQLTLRSACVAKNQMVDVAVNGTYAGSFRCNDDVATHRFLVGARTDGRNEIVVTTNRGVYAPGDPRELGLRLEGLGWKAVAP